jgi:putative flippase GtrA
LLTGKTESILVQLFRYTFVGGIAFLVDFGSLYALTEFFRIYYLVSAALAFLLGLTTNYTLSITWVFATRVVRSRWVEFGIFGGIGIVGLGLNEVLIWFFTEQIGLYYLWSKIIASIGVYFWNFFARKFTLFR